MVTSKDAVMTQTIHDITSFVDKADELLLLSQTELVKKNLPQAMEYFQSACDLKPQDPEIYFEQGLSLFDFASEPGKEKAFLLANKHFKIATSILPEYFEAWQLWGTALSTLGKFYQESHYFFEAKEKLQKAIDLSAGKEEEVLHDLYAEIAVVKAELAKRSGEACDWQLSIEAFEKASKFSAPINSDFWNQFGLSYQKLSFLLSDTKTCVKAIHCFKHAITNDASHYDSWKNLTQSMQFLQHCTHDEDHFFQAGECFNACIQLKPLDPAIWLEWALFLMKTGRITRDQKKLYSSIEKYRKAHSLELSGTPLSSKILAFWGEALALIGEISEQVELIHEGQNKILEALEIESGNAEIWQAFGESFNSLGRYFEEEDYRYQAIEQFQQGLSIDRTKHELWRAIGATYFEVGKEVEDAKMLEQALHFYNKALHLESHHTYYHFEHACCLSKLGEITLKEDWFEQAISSFEKALHMQKNAIYLHPDWLFQYAKTLDLYAEFFEEERHYHKAIEIYSHILMVDPDFPGIHYNLALAHSHLGELMEDPDSFYRALHFLKLAVKRDEDNDQILVDLGVTLINIAALNQDPAEVETCYQEAESKFIRAAKAGNLQAYYQLACLFSILHDTKRAMNFLLKAESFNALPPLDDLLADEWLDNVRSSSAFAEFMHYLEKKAILRGEL